MDIHGPEGPTRSFRDFAIHIVIVTIGILIALGLEGIRETVHEHHLIVETRATFRQELEGDRLNLVQETADVKDKSAQVGGILHDLPQLVKSSEELQKRVDNVGPAFYLFRGTAWGAASSSGVFAHMNTEEVNRFAEVYSGIEIYQQFSRQTLLDWTATKSFFDSRRSFSAQDAIEGEQKLRVLQFDLNGMKHLDQQFMDSLNAALGSS
jgi:hypothetical protein